jgi:hypothetical protein
MKHEGGRMKLNPHVSVCSFQPNRNLAAATLKTKN